MKDGAEKPEAADKEQQLQICEEALGIRLQQEEAELATKSDWELHSVLINRDLTTQAPPSRMENGSTVPEEGHEKEVESYLSMVEQKHMLPPDACYIALPLVVCVEAEAALDAAGIAYELYTEDGIREKYHFKPYVDFVPQNHYPEELLIPFYNVDLVIVSHEIPYEKLLSIVKDTWYQNHPLYSREQIEGFRSQYNELIS